MYHKIIFTYLTCIVKIWLWLWYLNLRNMSGGCSKRHPCFFYFSRLVRVFPLPPAPKIITFSSPHLLSLSRLFQNIPSLPPGEPIEQIRELIEQIRACQTNLSRTTIQRRLTNSFKGEYLHPWTIPHPHAKIFFKK